MSSILTDKVTISCTMVFSSDKTTQKRSQVRSKGQLLCVCVYIEMHSIDSGKERERRRGWISTHPSFDPQNELHQWYISKLVHTYLQVHGWGSLCGLREYITGERTDICLLCCNNRMYLFNIFFHFHFCRESASSNLKTRSSRTLQARRYTYNISFSFFYRIILFTIIFIVFL